MSVSEDRSRELVDPHTATDRRANPYRAGRSHALGRRGAVATSHHSASVAALDVLREGGSAMDAAITAAAMLAVVEPMMTGIGGDAFFIYWEQGERTAHGFNGSGRSPQSLLRGYFDGRRARSIEPDSWLSVTVPGAVDAWWQGHQRFGNLSWRRLLEPAIAAATEGFPVTEVVGRMWRLFAPALGGDPWAQTCYTPNGQPPTYGELFRTPHLGRTLERIAAEGRDELYVGSTAHEIARSCEEGGGFLTMDDLAAHRGEWVAPIEASFAGRRALQLPPNGQGLTALLLLQLIELGGRDVGSPFHPDAVHWAIEAKKSAYLEGYASIADPASHLPDLEPLLDGTWAQEQIARIDPDRASDAPPSPWAGHGDTVYLSVVDAEGNAASFINSIFSGFGAKVVAGETGILMQNRGCGFTLEPGHPNEYAPGKRPYHTIIPGMILDAEGSLELSYGVMGGPLQPSGHAQMLSAHYLQSLPLQAAIDLPRWRHTEGRTVLLEHGVPLSCARELAARGHDVRYADPLQFGGAQAISRLPTGTWQAASDPRKDGCALGY